MDINSRIYVAGHNGLVGSALIRILKKKKYRNIITRTHSELELTQQKEVEKFFKKKNLIMYFLLLPRLGEYMLITLLKLNLSIRI